jgi:predicted HTH transcriptional regulator
LDSGVAERNAHSSTAIEGNPLTLEQVRHELLHLLREHKALTPREIWDAVGVSKQGALDLLRSLMKAGLVQRIGTKKAGRYVLS